MLVRLRVTGLGAREWAESESCYDAPSCQSEAASSLGSIGKTFTSFSYLDLNLVHTVPKVTARIPARLHRLNAPRAIGCARENYVGSRLDWMPVVMPQTPGVLGVIRTENGWVPRAATVG